jgi:hypothetical protein
MALKPALVPDSAMTPAYGKPAALSKAYPSFRDASYAARLLA